MPAQTQRLTVRTCLASPRLRQFAPNLVTVQPDGSGSLESAPFQYSSEFVRDLLELGILPPLWFRGSLAVCADAAADWDEIEPRFITCLLRHLGWKDDDVTVEYVSNAAPDITSASH